jgi:hypothetical protein
MNIFPIDKNPKKCAEWSCDQHVVKIISEAVLIYSSALSYYDKEKWNEIPKEYKYGPINLPLVRWAINKKNRNWLAHYIFELNKEYEFRYEKKHRAYQVFIYLANEFNEMPYRDIELEYPEDFVQCMPDEFKCDNSIEAYKKYYTYKYIKGFKRPMRWSKRNKPEFLSLMVG